MKGVLGNLSCSLIKILILFRKCLISDGFIRPFNKKIHQYARISHKKRYRFVTNCFLSENRLYRSKEYAYASDSSGAFIKEAQILGEL
jgi:hypothetical protein